jgi:hypothetical protein
MINEYAAIVTGTCESVKKLSPAGSIILPSVQHPAVGNRLYIVSDTAIIERQNLCL